MGSNSSRPAVYDAPAYGILNTFLFLTTMAIIARSTSRYMQRVPFWWDDGLAWAAYLSNTVAIITENTVVAMGVMNLSKVEKFTAEQAESFSHRDLASSIMYIITIASAKLSILCLCRRVFGMYQRWFKLFWWFNFFVILPCWTGALVGLIIWANDFKFAFTATAYATSATSLVNVLSDIMVLILPVSGVLRLRLSGPRKFGIITVFCLGFMTILISLVRLIIEFRQAARPLSWNAAYSDYNFSIVSYAETSAATLCACIPVSKPFIAKISQIASANMSKVSLRALVSRTSTSSASRTGSKAADEKSENTKESISRTVAVDVHSVTLQQTDATVESLQRPIILGFFDRGESRSDAFAEF